ncbi:response regulator [Pseudomaricurvus alkylphenolicus]|jgi:putative two-component system response regulator|uniref:HD domain-containing phosphohydrolase n=1 Tax=Pseudomaricurvus alkylphenolicus TaxID=1306991 RepID=UPI0014213F89|nr:HD domain-containing phosphohydrolase [Pseudomaricurvus alkylphenolicus]NIB39367.1 response regulator [Pseudomaricurvus alkylphenolicus]
MTEPTNVHLGRILVVDDNPVNIAIVEKILCHDGYTRVDSTTNPLEVTERYRRDDYDLILLDVHMPEMSGIEVLAELRQQHPGDYLPVLILTADHTEETRNQCLAGGAKDFIGKPFDRTEVCLRVRNILEVRLLHKAVLRQNEELEDKVRERTRQLHEAQVKLIQCLGKAAEYRDNETGMHVIRMSQSCAILAKEMGLSDEECELIQRASPMHDIGKIAIPDDVLLKPGDLEGREWETMKTHAEVGAEILGGYDTELMQVAAKIALTHHERWDGRGYPDGLRGREIPLYTRIVSVCDVFDALTSKRPYKPAWSHEEAMEYLWKQSGHYFDPEVVSAFARVLDKVVALRQSYPDNPVAPLPDHRNYFGEADHSLGSHPNL